MRSSIENPSIYISGFRTISREMIRRVFDKLKLGSISHIDIRDKHKFRSVYIYYSYWYQSVFAQNIKKKLLDGEEIKVIYKEPWFWKCRLNRQTYYDTNHDSKYNNMNQIVALKKVLSSERENFQKILAIKNTEIKQLRQLLVDGFGDDALLHRKRFQQMQAKQTKFLDSSGILF